MNNHWGTNYRAYQEGSVRFRYLLRPHDGFDPLEASRLAIAASQPLVAVRGRGPAPAGRSRLRLTAEDVLVTGLKPSDDGRALMVRIWGGSGRDRVTRLEWGEPRPVGLWESDTSEQRLRELEGEIAVPAWGLVTVRAELGEDRLSNGGAAGRAAEGLNRGPLSTGR
jgi:hypothetical protein